MKQKFIPCRTCRNKEGPKPGFYYEDIEYGQGTYRLVVECECHKEWKHKNMFHIQASRGSIWPESLDYDPDKEYEGTQSVENVERFKKYVNRFDEYTDVMVYLYGPNGTQKTTLAQWAGATLLYKGYRVQYVLMQNLLEMLSEMTRDPDAENEKKRLTEKLKTIDLLIIDEAFSKDKVTLYKSGFQLPFLDRFLRERFEMHRKGIVFISNHPPESIAQQGFSKSIEDLVVRKTRPNGSALEFLDNYVKSASNFDTRGIFD